MEREYSYLKEVHSRLKDTFGTSFCFAKWYQANVYLQLGETHSCYHPKPHLIPLEELKDNPHRLHNTEEKLEERMQMLAGSRPKGCQYCWNIEDLSEELISDRQIRSGSIYREELVEEVKTNGVSPEAIPEYVEVSFGNECNFACGYCHPKSSSRYLNEVRRFGKFERVAEHSCDLSNVQVYSEENNPYLESWWNWWPSLKNRLTILRITGGEPLVQKSTAKLLELLNLQPAPHLQLKMNSNLGANFTVVSSAIDRITQLQSQRKIQSFELFTSMDAWGKKAEYLRYGLETEVFEKNLRHVLSETEFPITIMITFQLFSIGGIQDLLGKILEWRSEFGRFLPDGSQRLRFDLSYLKEPICYDMHLLPKEKYSKVLEESLKFLEKNLDDKDPTKFSFMDLQRWKRLYLYFCSQPYDSEKIRLGRIDHYHFFRQLDERRKLDRFVTFPELREFFSLCEREVVNQIRPDAWAKRDTSESQAALEIFGIKKGQDSIPSLFGRT